MIARIALSLSVAAAVVAVTTSHGEAQSSKFRRGGPHDWSHGRLLASRFGPDNDRQIAKDWRTFAKQTRIADARALKNPPIVSWFDLLEQVFGSKPAPKPTGEHLDWNLRTGGNGNVVGTPAKYSWDISASNCSDVIYFTVDQNGATGPLTFTPNVIAITNAYAGCSGNAGGTTPTVKWAIALPTGTATSPVPSLDGSVLYVLEKGSAGVVLHAINVNNITSNPGVYNFATTSWTSVHTLAAPNGTATSEQLFQLTFAGVTNNVASPWLDYTGNQIFFGDSVGRIRHVINTHLTTASIDTTNFTNACGANQLQSPVFVNNQVITTSYNGRLYRLDTTGAAPYACVASAQIGSGTAAGIAGSLSAPVVDITNDAILFATNDDITYNVQGLATFALTFAAGSTWASGAMTGNAVTTAPVTPSFDDDFWSNNSGSVYAVGSRTTGTDTCLVRVPYNGTLGTAAGYASLHRTTSSAAQVATTSPVTEFLTASSLANKDFIFVGGGSGNYQYMNRIGANFAGTDAAPVAMASFFQPANSLGIVSGISIDTRTANITGGTATANIYFGTIGSGLTQSQIIQLAQQF